jgi:hypothetical protein
VTFPLFPLPAPASILEAKQGRLKQKIRRPPWTAYQQVRKGRQNFQNRSSFPRITNSGCAFVQAAKRASIRKIHSSLGSVPRADGNRMTRERREWKGTRLYRRGRRGGKNAAVVHAATPDRSGGQQRTGGREETGATRNSTAVLPALALAPH